jgi:chorismate mutase/prephenate dehydratase
VAAIASSLVAESSGLATVAAGIEDRRDNTTRFLVLGGEPSEPTGNDLTSLIFTVRKGESGALYRLLEPFARHGVNLTSIQARPLKGTPWEYVFYFDLEGHPSEERVARACEEAAKLANSGRVLGAFPRAIQDRVGSEGTPS